MDHKDELQPEHYPEAGLKGIQYTAYNKHFEEF